MTDVVPRKRPWELHVLVCLHAIAIGFAVSTRWMDLQHPFIIAGLSVLLVGLFRGNRVAWWATATAFAILVAMTLQQSGETFQNYGLRTHPKLLRIHATTILVLVSFFLLVVCWYRGAIPPKAAPLLDELPAARNVIAVAAPILFVIAAFFSLSIVLLFHTGRDYRERSAWSSIRVLPSAEADFRANDRDENLINDFWSGDVRGLYCIVGAKTQTPIQLIELSTAAADGAPLVDAYPPLPAEPVDRGGTWYAALIEDRSVTPPEVYGRRNTTKFGFLTYPDDYVMGPKYAFFVNENNTIFRRALTGDLRASEKTPPGPLKLPAFTGWPSDEELKAHWSKLD